MEFLPDCSAGPQRLPVVGARPLPAGWLAASVRSRHEKSVAQHLERSSVECFVPLYEVARRWKDRRVDVRLPLFPGYVFVHSASDERMRVVRTPGVVKLVTFQGRPAVIPSQDIEYLRLLFANEVPMQPHPYLSVGRRVRIVSGPFAGMEGTLVRKKGSFRFVLSLDLIARSVVLEIDACDVSPVPQHHPFRVSRTAA